jgi:hypothetical protein
MYPSTTSAHYNLEDPRPRCSMIWERFERIFELLLRCFVVALLSLILCVLLLCYVLMCVLAPSLTLILIVIILCKAWEASTCGDFSQTCRDIRKNIVALKFDIWVTWDGLSATFDQRRSPQRGVVLGRTPRNIVVSLIHFTLLRFLSYLVLKLYIIIVHSLIHISRE